jgi:hypothetical protein
MNESEGMNRGIFREPNLSFKYFPIIRAQITRKDGFTNKDDFFLSFVK